MTETLTFLFNRSRQRYFKENICIFKDEDGNFIIVKPNKEIMILTIFARSPPPLSFLARFTEAKVGDELPLLIKKH